MCKLLTLAMAGSVGDRCTFCQLFRVNVTTKVLNVQRWILAVSHGFIKSNVLGSLDDATLNIDMMGIAHRLLVSEENAGSCMDIKLGVTVVKRKGINATAEHTEKADVNALPCAKGNGSFTAVATWKAIVDECEVAKSIRPIFERKASTKNIVRTPSAIV